MKTYTKEELVNILDLHKKWLKGEVGGVRANISNSNLSGSNLSGSDLSYSDLSNSNLRVSNLSNSDLSNSDLSNSDLSNSDLSGSNLSNSDLHGSNIEGTKFSFPVTLPEGQFVAWKKVYDENYHSIILKLVIPADTEKVSTPIGRKCRASKAYVDSAWDMKGKRVKKTTFYSKHDHNFVYEVGKEVIEPKYDSDIRLECTSGIHFFVTEKEAREY